jgi:aspartate aminotransferase-like enzyme
MDRELFTPNRLFCPGPTPQPWHTKQAGLESDIYHRSKEFEALVTSCAQMLKPLFGTSTQPVILTSSGTGAMEAVVVNLTDADDAVIVVVGGKFGERWYKLNQTYGNRVTSICVENGKAPTVDQITDAFKQCPNPKAFFFQAHETSTGARFDVPAIAAQVRGLSPDTLIVADAISSLGAHTMEMDKHGVDAVTAGSQKGFGVAPGLSFVALSTRAWSGLSSRAKFYFDLEKERKGQETGRTAWTPGVSLVQSLHAALSEISRIGPSEFAKHHDRLAKACRAAIKAIGLELFVEERAISSVLTAIKVPEGVDGSKILSTAKSRYGAIISGGQDELKGKIIRFSHLGFVSPFMLIEGLAALEFALADEGHKFSMGSGVTAAMNSLRS